MGRTGARGETLYLVGYRHRANGGLRQALSDARDRRRMRFHLPALEAILLPGPP